MLYGDYNDDNYNYDDDDDDGVVYITNNIAYM